LVEIDTDKETHEIRAPLTGVLSRIVVRDGASVAAGNHQAVDRQKPQLFLLQALKHSDWRNDLITVSGLETSSS